jgi:hypothetical protein
MKNSMKTMTATLIASAALTMGTTLSRGAAVTTTTYDWGFATDTTPVAPGTGPGSGRAVVAPGELSDGWMGSDGILGSAQGIWDLGQGGMVTLTDPNGFGGATGVQIVTVKVTQFQGGVYSQVGLVTVPGAELISQGVSVVGSGKLGLWVEQETDWRVPAGATVGSVVVTAPATRLLVDRVTVAASAGVQTGGPLLSIASLNNAQVKVSWATPAGNVVLESTTNINDPMSWTAVTEPVQASGGISSVTMSAIGPARFYRLKQP